jgi:hypothetical protein
MSTADSLYQTEKQYLIHNKRIIDFKSIML